MNDPRTFKIVSDCGGFFLENEYGEDETPHIRFWTLDLIEKHRAQLVKEYLDNYEPPETGDSWSGGFADNH